MNHARDRSLTAFEYQRMTEYEDEGNPGEDPVCLFFEIETAIL